MSFFYWLGARLFFFLPTKTFSSLWGRCTRSAFSRRFVRLFARVFGIDGSENELGLDEYPTLNAFFTRKLKPGARPVDSSPGAILSPVDGRVSEIGIAENNQLLQVKGCHFSLEELLHDDLAAKCFASGHYATLYLSPRDYHRFHAPMDLSIQNVRHIPGRLYPVNAPCVRWVRKLYTKNERVVLYADSQAGKVAMVFVGAHCVGSIRLGFFEPPAGFCRKGSQTVSFSKPIVVNRGEELGMFEMGSTVVVLFEKGKVQLDSIGHNEKIKMGQRIGKILTNA
jgi:phosphatidylserine decarboxylase